MTVHHNRLRTLNSILLSKTMRSGCWVPGGSMFDVQCSTLKGQQQKQLTVAILPHSMRIIMLTHAIDQYNARCSVALIHNHDLTPEESWQYSRVDNRHLFNVLPGFLSTCDVRPSQIDLFGVGLGPGSFTGLRISISALLSMALPYRKPVRGISSGEAIAWAVMA